MDSICIHADCNDVMQIMHNGDIDLILTDPPYEISVDNYDGMPGGSWGKPGDAGYVKRPELDFGEWDKKPVNIDEMCKQFYNKLRKGGTAIIFYDFWKMGKLKEAAEAAGFSKFRVIHWQKTNPVPLNSKITYLSNSREYALVIVKGSRPTFNSEYDIGVYEYPILHGKERLDHPTQKPVDLFRKLIEKHSNQGDIVFDPFGGVGTTLAACSISKRRCISVEISDKYYQLSKERLNRLNSGLFKLSDICYYDESTYGQLATYLNTEFVKC